MVNVYINSSLISKSYQSSSITEWLEDIFEQDISLIPQPAFEDGKKLAEKLSVERHHGAYDNYYYNKLFYYLSSDIFSQSYLAMYLLRSLGLCCYWSDEIIGYIVKEE